MLFFKIIFLLSRRKFKSIQPFLDYCLLFRGWSTNSSRSSSKSCSLVKNSGAIPVLVCTSCSTPTGLIYRPASSWADFVELFSLVGVWFVRWSGDVPQALWGCFVDSRLNEVLRKSAESSPFSFILLACVFAQFAKASEHWSIVTLVSFSDKLLCISSCGLALFAFSGDFSFAANVLLSSFAAAWNSSCHEIHEQCHLT